MKKRLVLAAALVLLVQQVPVWPYAVLYKEEYYRLYHIHAMQYPDDVIENIYWLEKASRAPFSNPRYALSKIANEEDWEKYQALFMMHLNLKLIEQHLRLGKNWDKMAAYFYDAPWKEQYLSELEQAITCYKAGLTYWEEAKTWAAAANEGKFRFLFLTEVQNWEDERERISTGKLDYEKIITKELARIEGMKQTFLAMNEKT
jgi:hypothetical protein